MSDYVNEYDTPEASSDEDYYGQKHYEGYSSECERQDRADIKRVRREDEKEAKERYAEQKMIDAFYGKADDEDEGEAEADTKLKVEDGDEDGGDYCNGEGKDSEKDGTKEGENDGKPKAPEEDDADEGDNDSGGKEDVEEDDD